MADPKQLAAQESKSERFECVPPRVEEEIARSMGEGAAKYGRFNWREGRKVYASTYYAAARRHLSAWFRGEDVDPDSPTGESHLIKAITSIMVIRDAQLGGTMADDRNGPTRGQRYVEEWVNDECTAWPAAYPLLVPKPGLNGFTVFVGQLTTYVPMCHYNRLPAVPEGAEVEWRHVTHTGIPQLEIAKGFDGCVLCNSPDAWMDVDTHMPRGK